MQPRRVEDQDAVRGRGHDSRDPQITQDPRDHLADGPDSIGKLLLRHAGHHAAARMQPGGSEIQEMNGDALPNRTSRSATI